MSWSLDPSSGELLVRTGVAGPGARIGHRLTIAMRSWRADVRWRGTRPVSAELTVDTGSLEVLQGHGGVAPMAGPEKVIARARALKSLNSEKYPTIRFTADAIEPTETGYRLDGALEIHGVTHPRTVEVSVRDSGDDLSLSAEATVTQSDFGIKPFSLMMGTLRVADDVTVAFTGSNTPPVGGAAPLR